MLLQHVRNHFDFNFNKSYITTKSVCDSAVIGWINSIQCSFTSSTVSQSNEIPSKQHNMNWQVIVSSTKIFSLKQPTECFKHKVLPVKAHVLIRFKIMLQQFKWDWHKINKMHVPQTFVGVLLSAEPTDYLHHIQVFLCFGPFFHSIKTKMNIPSLLTWRFQDNDSSPTLPFQPSCWTRQQHVSEAGLREEPGN